MVVQNTHGMFTAFGDEFQISMNILSLPVPLFFLERLLLSINVKGIMFAALELTLLECLIYQEKMSRSLSYSPALWSDWQSSDLPV